MCMKRMNQIQMIVNSYNDRISNIGIQSWAWDGSVIGPCMPDCVRAFLNVGAFNYQGIMPCCWSIRRNCTRDTRDHLRIRNQNSADERENRQSYCGIDPYWLGRARLFFTFAKSLLCRYLFPGDDSQIWEPALWINTIRNPKCPSVRAVSLASKLTRGTCFEKR